MAKSDAAPASDALAARKRPPIGRCHLVMVMCGLVLLGGCNFALLKVTYTAYGDHRAFFVNQAINLLYIVYGGAVLYPRMLCTDAVSKDMMLLPMTPFVVMGILDSLGTFLTCLGTPYTPGSMTPLLNQLLIPFTMLVSSVWLRVGSRWQERLGAGLIVAGACISVVPGLVESRPDGSVMEARWYAILFYALSNLPMAMSSCFKEATFEENQLDVWYLTQWVSIWQFVVSFAYMPLLTLPGFGSQEGLALHEVPIAFMDGWRCYTQQVPECADCWAFALLTGYCGVNVCFNTLGLYLTKHGSAVLNALSYSILLPFTTILFFTPLLGRYQEPLTNTACFTFLGLASALTGFAIYQWYSQNVGEDASSKALLPASEQTCSAALPLLEEVPALNTGQLSFQERVIFARTRSCSK